MNLNLYFLRHGETTYSAKGVYCGALDPELTAAGTEMAQAFAQVHQSIDWTAIVSSPMRRALATAQPLSDITGLAIQVRDGLQEIQYGQWEGLRSAEVNQQDHDAYLQWLADPGWYAPTGGERGVDIAKRATQVVEEIQELYSNGHVLVTSHKATLRILICVLMGIEVSHFRDRVAMPVGGLSHVEFTSKGPLLHTLADRSYLAPDLRARSGS